MINLTSRDDIVIVYHYIVKGIGESEHIYIEINIVSGICCWSKIISPTLGKIQLLSCISSFIIINSKVRATNYGMKYDPSDWKYKKFVLSKEQKVDLTREYISTLTGAEKSKGQKKTQKVCLT